MPTTDTLITDPATLGGFIERHGIRAAIVGDDGEVFLAIGHHDPATIGRVFDELAREYIADQGLSEYNLDGPEEAADALMQRWGRFTAGRGDTDWWCDWTATSEEQGTIPVTVLDAR